MVHELVVADARIQPSAETPLNVGENGIRGEVCVVLPGLVERISLRGAPGAGRRDVGIREIRIRCWPLKTPVRLCSSLTHSCRCASVKVGQVSGRSISQPPCVAIFAAGEGTGEGIASVVQRHMLSPSRLNRGAVATVHPVLRKESAALGLYNQNCL